MRSFARRLVVPSLLLAAACASRPEAEAALRDAEAAITAQHADAIRYAPEAFRDVSSRYTAARAALDSGDYRTAVREANEAARRARQLPAVITAAKDSLRPRWEELSGNLSLMVTAIEERLAEVDRTGRRPAGATTEDVTAARADLDSLRLGVRKATAAWHRGDLADAVHAADRLQSRGLEALKRLGVEMGPHGQ